MPCSDLDFLELITAIVTRLCKVVRLLMIATKPCTRSVCIDQSGSKDDKSHDPVDIRDSQKEDYPSNGDSLYCAGATRKRANKSTPY